MTDRAVICVCGTTSPADAHYCEGCGRRVDADELLDLDAPTGPEAAGVDGEGDGAALGSRRIWLPALVALAVLAGIIGAVVVTTGNDGEPAAGADEATEEGAPEGAPDDDASAGEEASGEEASAEDAAEGGEVAADGPAPPVATVQVEPLAPDADYQLVIGTRSGPVVIDAWSGEVRRYERTEGAPVAVADGWLVFERSQLSSVVALSLDDLGGPARPFRAGGFGSSFVAASPRDGLVVLETFSETGPGLTVMDIAGREDAAHPVTELPVVDLLTGPPFVVSAERALFTPVGGGVYRLEEAGARQLADGRMVATDGDRILVESCDEAFVCSRSWVDAEGEPLDLALPPEAHDALTFAPGTDWLASNVLPADGVVETVTLTDVVTGQVVDAPGTPIQSLGFFWLGVPPAISPDGQWLASASSGSRELEFRNLATDEVRVIELPVPYASGLVFAPR